MVNVRWRHDAGIYEYSVPKNQQQQKRSLVGGFNPSQKYLSKWNSSPSRGENNRCLKPPPRCLTRHHGKNQKTSFLATNLLQPGPQPKTTPKVPRHCISCLVCPTTPQWRTITRASKAVPRVFGRVVWSCLPLESHGMYGNMVYIHLHEKPFKKKSQPFM